MLLRRWREESAKNAPPDVPSSPDDTLIVPLAEDEIILSRGLAARVEGPAVQYQFPAPRGSRERRIKTADGKEVVITDANYFFSSER